MATKAEKLRIALRDAGAEGLTPAECTKIAGGPGQFSNFVRRGEVIATKGENGKHYTLDPDYTPTRQRRINNDLPLKRPKKKKATPRKTTTNKPIAPNVREYAVDNMMAAGRQLLMVVRDRVDGLETDPILSGAVDMYERTSRMAEAVGA